MTSSASHLNVHAPGSLMLMGEHAVLHGQPALCMAVNQRMRLHLQIRQDRKFTLCSALGEYEGDLNDIEVCKPFTFLLEAVRRTKLAQGFDLNIHSEFSSTIGFGSSAAVTVSMVTLLRELRGKTFDRAAIFHEALEVIRAVQGRGSGSDVAASVYGGVVHYRAEPLQLEPLRCSLPLSVVYCGYKTPTPEVIRIVEANRKAHPEKIEGLFKEIGKCVTEAVPAIRQGDPEMLGKLFDRHHSLQADLGCSDDTLEFLVQELRKNPNVLGAKISGSGLGDCVIALGHQQATVPGYDSYSVEPASEGVTLER